MCSGAVVKHAAARDPDRGRQVDQATDLEAGEVRTLEHSHSIADGLMAAVEAGAAPTGTQSASAALLLEPTPASEIVAVAADGDVMPQKSTYIYPKALTGLVINPLE